jgi:hypothetical protein
VSRRSAWRFPRRFRSGFHSNGGAPDLLAEILTDEAWLPALKRIIPAYGIDLKRDADACRRTRADTAAMLLIENI